MAPASTADGASARDAFHSVDQILEELDRLATTELADSDFYAAVMARLSSLGCSAAAIWLLDADGTPQLAWQSAASDARANGESSVASHQAAASAAIEDGQPKLIEKPADGNGAGSSIRSIIAPWSPANITHGALQVWLSEKVNASALAGFLQVLAAVGEL